VNVSYFDFTAYHSVCPVLPTAFIVQPLPCIVEKCVLNSTYNWHLTAPNWTIPASFYNDRDSMSDQQIQESFELCIFPNISESCCDPLRGIVACYTLEDCENNEPINFKMCRVSWLRNIYERIGEALLFYKRLVEISS